MTDDQKRMPRWNCGILVLCAVAISAAAVYRLVWHVEREWVQVSAGEIANLPNDTVIPRVFDRRSGELCEYRGAGAKGEYTSQVLRGPWICFPGPR